MELLLQRSGLAPLRLAGRVLLPIVQGGMGIGVSAHGLAGSVAAAGGVSTLSAVDLRRHHPDLMARTTGPCVGAAAKRLARGLGLLAMNVMRAVSEYAAYVRCSLEAGIDAIVLEHPGHAGGHLGAARLADLHDPRFDFERCVPETLALLRAAGIEHSTPIIVAGGIRTLHDIQRMQALGAAVVQLGTAWRNAACATARRSGASSASISSSAPPCEVTSPEPCLSAAAVPCPLARRSAARVSSCASCSVAMWTRQPQSLAAARRR